MRRALKMGLALLAGSGLLIAQNGWEATPAFALPASPFAIARPAQPRLPFLTEVAS